MIGGLPYDSAGSIASKSDLGSYTYPLATANRPHATSQGGTHSFTYDVNGNMLTGLYGKTMAYDGENRPVSVSHQGDTTSYAYGPDGQRIWGLYGSFIHRRPAFSFAKAFPPSHSNASGLYAPSIRVIASLLLRG